MNRQLKFLFPFMIITICLTGCNNHKYEMNEEFEIANDAELLVDNQVEKLEYWTITKDKNHSFNIPKNEINDEEVIEEETSEKTSEFETLIGLANVANVESSNYSSIGISNKIAEKQTLTIQQKNEILKQIDECNVTNKETLYDLIYLIDSNISSFDQRERDLMVKKYMLSLYSLMNNLNSVLEVVGYDLENAVNEFNININDKASIETLPDTYGVVKGFLLEVKSKGFFVNSNGDNEGFYLDLDLGNMIDKYNEYISPSFIKYIEFNNYEMNNILSDYNIEEIANRIKMLEDGMRLDKKNHYVVSDRYVTSITYYYQILLGLSHNNFVDANNKFNQKILNEYSELKASETTMDILNKMTLAIQANDMIYDETVKELVYDYMNSKIYSDELIGVFDNKNTYKYAIVSEEDLKPIIPEIEEETETETEIEEETTSESKTNNSTSKPNNTTQNPVTTKPSTPSSETTELESKETETDIQVIETELE